MARTKRDKSASISSVTAPTLNGSMLPPSSPSPGPVSTSTRSSPTATRRKASSVSRGSAAAGAVSSAPKSAHAPPKPSHLKFVAVILISLVAEAAGQSAASLVGGGELAAISKLDATNLETGALLAWKILLLGTSWYGGLDAVDVASLNTLVQTPIFVLLHYFYLISASTLVATCSCSILSQALPFYLLRTLSAPHSSEYKRRNQLRNRIIIFDPVTTLATSATATFVYAITLQFAFSTFFPEFMIVHFDGLRDLTWAHNIGSTLPALIVWLAPAGIATTQFLFRPAEGAAASSPAATGANSVALTHDHFDPETASFAQHIYFNIWGWYTSRQKELIGRTILLGIFFLAEVVVHISGTFHGVDVVGATGYASIWVTAAVILGITLEWVGGPSD